MHRCIFAWKYASNFLTKTFLKIMELLIGTACVGAITYYGYLMAKYFDAKAEEDKE